MNKEIKPGLLAVLLITLFISVLFIVSSIEYMKDSKFPVDSTITGFKSDLNSNEGSSSVYKSNLAREEIFIAFSSYITLVPGEYNVSFYFTKSSDSDSKCVIDIVSDKGRNIVFSPKKLTLSRSGVHKIKLTVNETKEIEPRVKSLIGNNNLKVDKVVFSRETYKFPIQKMVLRSLYLTPIFYFALLSFLFAYLNDGRWKNTLAMFLMYTGIFLIMKYAWMSEDALITMRHVDNFISGNGLVFNPGERVEGYTHTLWFYIISLLRWIGFSPKGALLFPGIIFSLLSLYFLFFRIGRKTDGKPVIALSGAVLIGMSSFIDFGTSGLETSLSYFLLILFSLQLLGDRYKERPEIFGITVALMTFNRPDFGIFLIFSLLVFLHGYLKREIDFKTIIRFFYPPLLLLSIYELFRMGYYGALFPNPFYAKSGSSSYFSQGFKYIEDLFLGSAFILIVILSLFIFFLAKKMAKKEFTNRTIVFFGGVFYAFFVIRGGGDFMHGRFLLPTVLLLVISSTGIFDNFFTRTKTLRITGVVLIIILVIISRSIIPVQKRGGNMFSNGISDERFAFYGNNIFPLKKIFTDDHIFMWKTIGKNYKFLSENARKKIKIAYHTVGFLGYYSGDRVNVLDRLGLTDPIVARRKIVKRGRPGHEKSAPFGYLVYRELTFGDTPFKIWNELATTKFGILWDLSRKTLSKFSFFLDKDFKSKLDSGILSFLESLDPMNIKNNSDFLFFLKKFWYPFASEKSKKTFENLYNEDLIKNNSESYKWILNNKETINDWDSVIKGRMNWKKFLKNIGFALKELIK